MRRTASLAILILFVLAANVAIVLVRGGSPYRAFSDDSYWNTPIPPDAAPHPRSAEILSFLRSDNDGGHLRFAGLDGDGEWGMPFYWTEPQDRRYDVSNSCSYFRPPEFDAVPIPAGAAPDVSDDGHMTVIDVDGGVAYGFYEAEYDAGRDAWSACGGSVWYLDSNGLEASVTGTDCTPARFPPTGCRGHRGFPHPIHAVRLDEAQVGAIEHVLKIAVVNTCGHVWPAAGDEGCDQGGPPEGTRLRLRLELELDGLGLSPAALSIARALQEYGAVIGDRSGAGAMLKVEDCVAQGDGQCWDGLLEPNALSSLPFTPEYWEVLEPQGPA